MLGHIAKKQRVDRDGQAGGFLQGVEVALLAASCTRAVINEAAVYYRTDTIVVHRARALHSRIL